MKAMGRDTIPHLQTWKGGYETKRGYVRWSICTMFLSCLGRMVGRTNRLPQLFLSKIQEFSQHIHSPITNQGR